MSNDLADAGVDIDTFFAGVAQVRAYLDRHIQDPNRQRARLSRIARDLLKPRGMRRLVHWLARQVREALGARACGVWIDDDGWGEWSRAGATEGGPTPELLESLGSDEIVGTPVMGMTVPVPGLNGPVGALWISGGVDLADESRDLIQAIAGATGMVLDHALKADAIARDPTTGLLPPVEFARLAELDLRQSPSVGYAHAIMGLRSGQLQPRELTCLARAARDIFPPGTLCGSRFADAGARVDLFAIPPLVATSAGDTDLPQYVANVAATLATDAWVGSYWMGEAAVDAVAPILDRLSSEMDDAEPMEVCQLGGRLDSTQSNR